MRARCVALLAVDPADLAEALVLAGEIGRLPFSDVRMHGVVARRRTAHFGWLYSFESFQVRPGPPIPAFLEPARARCAALLAVDPADLAEALVTEYRPGAGIGRGRPGSTTSPPPGSCATRSPSAPCARNGDIPDFPGDVKSFHHPRNEQCPHLPLPPALLYSRSSA